MKAAIINQYGSAEVLQYTDIEQPQIKANQILIRVYASSVNPIDWKIRNGMLKLLTGNKFPIILGFDVAGEVLEVGEQVKHFKVGDAIYACLESTTGGAYAECAAVSDQAAALKPSNMTDHQAAAVPLAALTALQALRDIGQVKPGQHVLVNGSSGGVGTFAVQIAKALGAEVAAVCSTRNIELVNTLGADQVIDYTQQDFTQLSTRYDTIFDTVGKQSFSRCKQVLQPNGVYITTLPSPDSLLQSLLTLFLPGKKAKLILSKRSGKDLAYLKQLIEAGKIQSIIDRTYLLSEIAEAHTYSEQEHATGKIAITVSN